MATPDDASDSSSSFSNDEPFFVFFGTEDIVAPPLPKPPDPFLIEHVGPSLVSMCGSGRFMDATPDDASESGCFVNDEPLHVFLEAEDIKAPPPPAPPTPVLPIAVSSEDSFGDGADEDDVDVNAALLSLDALADGNARSDAKEDKDRALVLPLAAS